MLQEEVAGYLSEIETAPLATPEALEAFRLRFLSRNGLVQALFGRLKEVEPAQRREVGQLLNNLKNKAEEAFAAAKAAAESAAESATGPQLDLTLPPPPHALGSRHILNVV